MTLWSSCSRAGCSEIMTSGGTVLFDLRFKRSVGNAIRNMVEKQRNARRLLPTVSIGQERGDDFPDWATEARMTTAN